MELGTKGVLEERTEETAWGADGEVAACSHRRQTGQGECSREKAAKPCRVLPHGTNLCPGRSCGVQLRLGAGKHACPCVFTRALQGRHRCPCLGVHVLACEMLCDCVLVARAACALVRVFVCMLTDASSTCRYVFLCALVSGVCVLRGGWWQQDGSVRRRKGKRCLGSELEIWVDGQSG